MTGGGGLLFLLANLVVAVTIAKHQECKPGPPWTADGENVMEKTRGNVTLVALLQTSSHFCQRQALSMETLLNDLRDYGLQDLSFLIINSKESMYHDAFRKLRGDLSFPMYQEANEEQVWDTVDGNTNDMFVYDRCGRLTYYIPFPLSKLKNNQPVVRTAILSTYFRNPCGMHCGGNEIDFMDIQEESYQPIPNDKLSSETAEPADPSSISGDVEDTFSLFDNDTSSEKSAIVEDINFDDMEDYYGILDNSTESNFTVSVNSTERRISPIPKSKPTDNSILSSLVNFIWGNVKHKDPGNTRQIIEDKNVKNNLTDENLISPNINDDLVSSNTVFIENITTLPENGKGIEKGYCEGVDENVCMDWSKSKMIHAQNCCRRATQATGDRQHCKHFGKKRCKKIQSLLKCCLKTELSSQSGDLPSHEAM